MESVDHLRSKNWSRSTEANPNEVMAMSWSKEKVKLVGDDQQPKATKIWDLNAKQVATSEAERGNSNLLEFDWLPILLAGPIVRRLQRTSVWLWLATSIPVTVTASVQTTKTPSSIVGRGKASSFRLGERLHITLIRV